MSNGRRKPVTAKAMSAPTENTKWVDERLAHDQQRRKYKTYLFWGICILCAMLYGIFFSALVLLMTHTVAMQAFFAHKHVLGLLLALLVVPSVMAWGLIRAVYRVEHPTTNYGELFKSGISMHPFG
ncbi:MAG: hypothetical protein RBR49_11965 [Desulfovibrio desulfuricans]|nr:hypothetical protein [Desulfovibrio desulfuricans]